MKIKLLNESPYADLICQYFSQIFPKTIVANSKQLLEILTTILVGDKNLRLGPVPPPESLVVIRATISKAIELGVPIPIIVAWGGRKTIATESVDVAEIAAIYQLVRLQESIKQYYSPGLLINIRIEDTGAYWLYRSEENIDKNVDKYSTDFTTLVKILGIKYNIFPIRESSLMNKTEYFQVSNSYSKLLEDAITRRLVDETADMRSVMQPLIDLGWKGNLPVEQIHHYIGRYQILYPNLDMIQYITMAADYLGGAKARYDLNGRAEPDTTVGSVIAISFIPPIPGAPVSLFNNNLYYRTVSEKDSRTHIAPWRAKGYLEIDASNSIKIKITSWNNSSIIGELTPTEAQLTDNIDTVTISTDYFIKENPMAYMMPIF